MKRKVVYPKSWKYPERPYMIGMYHDEDYDAGIYNPELERVAGLLKEQHYLAIVWKFVKPDIPDTYKIIGTTRCGVQIIQSFTKPLIDAMEQNRPWLV